MGIDALPERRKGAKRIPGLDARLFIDIERSYNHAFYKYHFYNVSTYILLCAQLCLSTVIVILGSIKNVDFQVATSVIGAIGALIAGILAFMKGQGLPNRYRQTRAGLSEVLADAKALIEHFEGGLDVSYNDIELLREKYRVVRKAAEANHPDVWNSNFPKYFASIPQLPSTTAPAETTSPTTASTGRATPLATTIPPALR
jgi:hypothetical protein